MSICFSFRENLIFIYQLSVELINGRKDCMPDRIICAVDDHLCFFEGGESRIINSGFLEQYRRNQEQTIRKRAWRYEGEGAMFQRGGVSFPNLHSDHVPDNAHITGIAAINKNEILYSVSVGDASGILRRHLDDTSGENEGHILHDRGLQFEGLSIRTDGKVALSVRDRNGDWHIATSLLGSPQYTELTEGNSIDRNPAWDAADQEVLYYDSAILETERSGGFIIGPRAVLRLHLAKPDIEEILCDDRYDYFCPQTDTAGNLWCIRRPYAAPKTSFFTLKDILLMPARIGSAIFRAIEFFTWRHTGQTLATGGANPAKIREAPKELLLEDIRIDATRSLRDNRKAGDRLPGIIPRNWELIRYDNSGTTTVHARGVCSFTLSSHGELLYSNGRYIFTLIDGKSEKVFEEELPRKITVIPN
jgi:hypothetical protein